MADAIVQVAPNSTGEKIDGDELTVGANTVFRQRIAMADPTTAAALAKVQNAQPADTDYGLTVRPAGDGKVVLNAASVTAAATLWTADVSGYRAFQFQLTGTFTATLVVEGSDDNSNWNTAYWLSSTTSLPSAVSTTFAAAVLNGYGPIRTKYLRVRCSAFTSNTSSALTFVLRSGALVPELVNVNQISNTVTVTPTPPVSALGTTSFVKAAASTNATSVKGSAGSLLGGVLVNNSTAVKYFKWYNKASAPTVGTDTPVATLGIPANGGNLCLSDDGYANARFTTGIAYAITGAVTDADTTAVAANDVSGWILYS